MSDESRPWINIPETSKGIKRGGIFIEDFSSLDSTEPNKIFIPKTLIVDSTGNFVGTTIGDMNTQQVLVQVELGNVGIFLFNAEYENLYDQNGYILTGV